MAFTFRPATRENTPLIIGLAGPTKSGKTLSALRLAHGMANGGAVAMINAEGPKGHQYAARFTPPYMAGDIDTPYTPERYTEAIQEAGRIKPTVLIIDSMSHMHDGPGGVLEYHEKELDRMAGQDRGKRERMTWAAWVKPKAAENECIYAFLGLKCHVILCFRAKEKLKIVKGQDPIELGWQPIAGERVAFETLFTLVLPPHSKGVPDLDASDMREPFDAMIPKGKALDEDLGSRLAEWAKGAPDRAPAAQVAPTSPKPAGNGGGQPAGDLPLIVRVQDELFRRVPGKSTADKAARQALTARAFGVESWDAVAKMDLAMQEDGLRRLKGLPA